MQTCGGLGITSRFHSSHGGLSTAEEMENFLKRTLKTRIKYIPVQSPSMKGICDLMEKVTFLTAVNSLRALRYVGSARATERVPISGKEKRYFEGKHLS